uniref:glycosyltransferase n=1 Tax=Nocardia abscessus TaxID=120957 RepID=UPI002453946F
MRVLLTTWGSRGDVEPLAGLAVALRELGAEARVCAPPDEEFAKLLERVGVPLVPLGPTVHSVVANPKPPTAQDAFRLAPALVAARFDTLTAAAEGCDALLATGLMPAGARDVAEKLGIRYVLACFHIYGLPSRHFPPGRRPGTPSPQEETDNRVLWAQDAQRVNDLYGEALNSHRAAIGLPPVDNVRDYVFTGQPWLAADATLCPSQGMTDLDVVQTGAWILLDDRPLPNGLKAFLDAGAPPVYVGFGSMAAYAPKDIARVAIEAARAQGRRVVLARGWAELAPIDDVDDCFVVGEVNQQALFPRVAAVVHHGGAGTTTTAARPGAPHVIVPQIAHHPNRAAREAEQGIAVA